MSELHYGLKQPLRFYEKLEHQNRFKKTANNAVFKLYCPVNYILPFQIKRDSGTLPITSVLLIDVETGASTEMTTHIIFGQLQKYGVGDIDYLVNLGTDAMIYSIPEGQYYFVVSSGEKSWYSEVVTYQDFNPNTLENCALTKITYWDSCDVDGIFYRTEFFGHAQYKNILYLDLDIGQPTYEITEEGEEDGAGNFIAEIRRVEKKYLLQGLFPEYVVDALSVIPLHLSDTGKVEVYTHRGYTGEMNSLTLEPEWQGDYKVWALTDVVFSTMFSRKVNCCGGDNSELSADCVSGAIEATAEIDVTNNSNLVNYEYTKLPIPPGGQISLVDGDHVLFLFPQGPLWLLRTANVTQGFYGNYTSPLYVGDAIIDKNRQQAGGDFLNGMNPYFYFAGGRDWIQQKVLIDSYGPDPGGYKVQGRAWNNCLVTVYVNQGLSFTPVGFASGSDYRTSGIVFTMPPGATAFYMVATGSNGCTLGVSDAVKLSVFLGIGSAAIGSTFTIG